MALPNGTDVLINVESAVPGTYDVVGGQRDANISENRTLIETSSKDNPFRTGLPGMLSVTFTFDAIYAPADAGLVLLRAAMRAGTTLRLEVSEDGADTFNIDCVVTSMDTAAPDQDAATVAATMESIGDWIPA